MAKAILVLIPAVILAGCSDGGYIPPVSPYSALPAVAAVRAPVPPSAVYEMPAPAIPPVTQEFPAAARGAPEEGAPPDVPPGYDVVSPGGPQGAAYGFRIIRPGVPSAVGISQETGAPEQHASEPDAGPARPPQSDAAGAGDAVDSAGAPSEPGYRKRLDALKAELASDAAHEGAETPQASAAQVPAGPEPRTEQVSSPPHAVPPVPAILPLEPRGLNRE